MNLMEETKIDAANLNKGRKVGGSAPPDPYLIGMKWAPSRTRQTKQQFHPAIEDGKWTAELYFYFIYLPICHTVLPSLFTTAMEPIGWFARMSISRGSVAGANPALPARRPLFSVVCLASWASTQTTHPPPLRDRPVVTRPPNRETVKSLPWTGAGHVYCEEPPEMVRIWPGGGVSK